jgi:hypothetical protein
MMDPAALLTLPISLAGFLALGLAMHRTSRDALGEPIEGRLKHRLRFGAGAAFVLSFLIALSGGAVALVGGFMLLFAAGGLTVALYTWRPRWALIALKAAAVAGVIAAATAVVLAL